MTRDERVRQTSVSRWVRTCRRRHHPQRRQQNLAGGIGSQEAAAPRENLPLAHGKQPPCPASGCAYPAAHSLHMDAPAAENMPAGQSPLAAERAVPEQYLPGGQAVHDVWPARTWYWPAGHAAHEDDGAEKKEPAGHGAGADVDAGAVVP